jgi:hypothetical protein
MILNVAVFAGIFNLEGKLGRPFSPTAEEERVDARRLR